MDADEQLRNEISLLSSLIASNNGPTSRNGTLPSILHRPHYRHHPYQRSPSLVNHGIFPGSSIPRRGNVPSIYRYTNPVQNHVNAFPKTYQNLGSVSGVGSKTETVADTRRILEVEQQARNANPFKVVRSSTSRVLGDPTNTGTFVSSNLQIPLSTKATLPKSVHINPAHLVSSACAETLPLYTSTATTATSSSFKIRPHINPGHVAYQQLCNVPVTTSTGNMQSGSVNGYDHLSVVKNGTFSNQDGRSKKNLDMNSLSNDFEDDMPATATVVKSKYKVDRRFKNSPIKTGGLKRGINNRRVKIVKKYSTRLLSQSAPNLPSTSNKTVYRPSLLKFNNPYQKQFGKPWTISIGRSLKRGHGHIIKGRMPRLKMSKFHSSKKAIVHIAGNNYIRKNSGRTLRKIKQRSPAVVNIDGNQFISKNSGKSLKRLFKQSPTSRTTRNSISISQPQTTGKRLAQRAIFKSKLTLSQRTWKKKRFCVYYNRLGECKKNEEGNCPYIHDRNQLSICPKFVVGKCSIADCKLSHDLNIGRMPPCQFFNKSNCSRENCPYPHIKSTTVKRKSPRRESVKDGEDNNNPGESTGTPRKRKLSIRKEKRSPKITKKKEDTKSTSDEKGKLKARYYEQSPDSQPVVSIIPRRVRHEATPASAETDAVNKPNDGSQQISPSNAVQAEANHYNNSVAETCNAPSSNNTSCDTKILQRARLLKKVSRLQEKVKPKESNAPQFLPFN